MGLSKSNRIIILLVVDTVFFLLELITGYTVHSLALVADAFHMLNDVLSLVVGLWAVKAANRETTSKMYTYGWQRAETLGALVNGVFLVALCVSIFLEAIQRLVEPQEVQNPKFVFIVGCVGLLSNIFGLFLFHEHSHGHGHGHSHDHREEGQQDVDVEQGYGQTVRSDAVMPDKRDSSSSVTSESLVGRKRFSELLKGDEQNSTADPSLSYPQRRRTLGSQDIDPSGRSAEAIRVHPAWIRQDIIKASRHQLDAEQLPGSVGDRYERDEQPSEYTSLLRTRGGPGYTNGPQGKGISVGSHNNDLHKSHNHAQPNPDGQREGGHDLNLRGIFLHVIGDALGNIGVIVSALVIWLTKWRFKHYVDPGISLMITGIILCSAIPLCKAASRILLQAVPRGMSVDHIKEDIERLPGVIGSHHLHVWQLSDTKIVASIHLQIDTDIKSEGSDRYMQLARQVRECLHAYGIHSSTIQPEFAPESDAEDSQGNPSSSREGSDNPSSSSKLQSRTASLRESDSRACLLECGNGCGRGGQCCPRP